MPAEWVRHEATWLGWPHRRSDWPGRFAPIPWVYGEIVRKLAEGETVRIIVPSREQETRARKVLSRVGAEGSRV
jgi:agmatine deiminase